jgi:hypothetical protein
MLRLTGRVRLVATVLEVVLGNVLGDVGVVLGSWGVREGGMRGGLLGIEWGYKKVTEA